MSRVWTRSGAGTERHLVRSPIPERPGIHQIVLPLDRMAERAVHSVQVYLVEGEPLTLIDTGLATSESRAILESALEVLGHGLGEIERIVVTHAHSDHFGLAQALRASGASFECCVHADDCGTVEGWPEVDRSRLEDDLELFRESGVPRSTVGSLETHLRAVHARQAGECEATSVERVLRDGDRVAFKDFALVVRHSPGHTPGHILLEDEEHGLLFTGDQIMAEAIPHAERHYLGDAPVPSDPVRRRPSFHGLVEMRRSLRRIRGERFRRLLPGYGGIVARPDRAIGATLLFYDVRLQRIDRGLRRLAAMGQDVTAFEIWKSLFPPDESFEAMREHLLLVIGALDCLEAEGKIETLRRADGALVHHHR